jgi:hypothetical protein
VWATRSAASIRRVMWAVCGYTDESLARLRMVPVMKVPVMVVPSLEASLRCVGTAPLPPWLGGVSGRKPRFGENQGNGGISMSFLCWELCVWRHGMLLLVVLFRCSSLSKVELSGNYVRHRWRVQDDAFLRTDRVPPSFLCWCVDKESSVGVVIFGGDRRGSRHG